jgi:hypothetical protein
MFGGLLILRIVRIVAGIVVLIIALGILLVVLDANTANGIVSTIREWANTLTSPFHGIFHTSSHKSTIALNYGLAILVYLAIAGLIEALLSSASPWRGRAVPY